MVNFQKSPAKLFLSLYAMELGHINIPTVTGIEGQLANTIGLEYNVKKIKNTLIAYTPVYIILRYRISSKVYLMYLQIVNAKW